MAQQHVTFHGSLVTRSDRSHYLNMKGFTLWLTGLSASGKSTVACELERVLVQQFAKPAYRLDGDNLRLGLNYNLGFSAEDRKENIRRVAEVSKLFADSGMICISSFISPYSTDREMARKIHNDSDLEFIEVHIDVPLSVAEARDPKGLYAKARQGLIKGFTGIDDPYEKPEHPEIYLDNSKVSVDEAVDQILKYLKEKKLIQ